MMIEARRRSIKCNFRTFKKLKEYGESQYRLKRKYIITSLNFYPDIDKAIICETFPIPNLK